MTGCQGTSVDSWDVSAMANLLPARLSAPVKVPLTVWQRRRTGRAALFFTASGIVK